jgi:oligosaccharyltransferase complex subunit beta
LTATYSIFFADLEQRGHKLSFFQTESPALILKKHGEYLYDNIVFFAPTAEAFSTLTFDDFSEFVQDGGNILFGVNRRVGENVRDFLETFGVQLDRKNTDVIDHFDYEDSLDTR